VRTVDTIFSRDTDTHDGPLRRGRERGESFVRLHRRV
jgi:hypothetical protein